MAGSSLPVTWRLPPLEIPLGRSSKTSSWRHGAIWRSLVFTPWRRSSAWLNGGSATASRRVWPPSPAWKATPSGRRATKACGRGPLLEHALGRSHTLNPGDIKQNTRDFMPPAAPGRDALTKLSSPGRFRRRIRRWSAGDVLILNGHVDDTTIAARIERVPTGVDTIVSTLMYLPAPPGASFFNPLVLRIEDFFRTGQSPLSRRTDPAHRRHPRRGARQPDQRSPVGSPRPIWQRSIIRHRRTQGSYERRSPTRSPINCEPIRRYRMVRQ